MKNNHLLVAFFLLVAFLFTACGGGGAGGGASSGGDPQLTQHAVKVNATGIKATGFSLQLTATGNTTQSLTIAANGAYPFGTALPDSTPYSVSINSQPTGQTCFLGSNKTGTVSGTDIIINATCSDNSVSPTGISVKVDLNALSSGETIKLTLNMTEAKTFSKPFLGIDTFATQLNNGDPYVVSIQTPPSGKICNLEGATGVISGGASPQVTISCALSSTPTYTVGGAVTGLNGAGLQLKLNGSEVVAINAGVASYTFSTALPSNSWLNATVDKQPSGQICTISNASQYISIANITNVNVICSNGPHVISGSVTGLKGAGLVLLQDGVESLSISNSGVFSFPTALSDGMNYSVTVKTHPAGQTCTVYRGSGTGITSSITNILAGCVDNAYEIGSKLSGYNSTTPLSLSLNGIYQLDFTDNWLYSTKVFNTYLKDGATYNVTILAQPYGQICTLTNPSGTVQGANITNISASCTTQPTTSGPYSVSVTTTGLLGSGLKLQLNGASNLSVTANGYSTFTTLLNTSASYSVTVQSQPGSPLQKCNVLNGSGTIAGGNITNIAVVCGNAVTALFPVNGARWLDYVKNPSGTALTALQDIACDANIDNGDIGACLNGGAYRIVEVGSLASCAGVTATDSLNAFNWLCDSSTGKVRIISNGLKPGVLLSSLMDFDKAEFKSNFITISNGGVPITTQPAIWWKNTVQINNTGEYQCCGGNNTIVLVSDNVPGFYTMESKSALLVRPGFAISGYSGGTTSIVTNAARSYNNNNDYLWIEGKINDVAANTYGGIGLQSNFAVIQGVEVLNTGDTGVVVDGHNTTIRGLVSNNNAGEGIFLWGSNLDASTLTATGNRGILAAIGISVGNKTGRLSNIVASNNPNAAAGLRVTPIMQSVSIEGVVANNNGRDGVFLGDSTTSFIGRNNVLRNISASGNGNMGIYVHNTSDSAVSGLTANNNGSYGIWLDSSNNSPVSDVVTAGNVKTGTYLFRWDSTTFNNLITSNNGEHGLLVSQTSNLNTSNISSHNNAVDGFYLSGNGTNVWFNLTASNNGNVGINNSSNDFNVFMGITTVNNGSHGIANTRFNGTHFSSLLSARNGGDGMNNQVFVDNQVYSNMASANNAGYGINMDSSGDYYTGLLRVGTNTKGNCFVNNSYGTTPGLVQGGTAQRPTTDCIRSGLTDATIIQGVNLTTSMVGAVSSEDTVNASDYLGASLLQNISDWTRFANSYRAWGKDGALGRCALAGENCRIWDWSASLADTGYSGSHAVLNVLALPATGNETLTITGWPVTVTYLRNAVEISGDSIGNDNYLCESGETCLYTPNIGSYQGHGALLPAGSIGTAGILKNITLVRYELNGR